MSLRLFNTLTRTLEPFAPLDPQGKHIGIYVCGPTVYDVPHIGHARSAYVFDVLRRYLAFKYPTAEVVFVRNVTDVDDKIIAKAREELGARDKGKGEGDLKAKCKDVAERYLKSYHDALDRLGIKQPTIEPKATEHVVPDPKNVTLTKQVDASMTGFISHLMTKNMAYPADGDVYFSVRRYSDYGKLSNRSVDELKSGARIEPGEKKEDPLDFALWKAAKPDEPSWNSPWGPGRPGWHIECSVMSTAYLGDAFDIHGGGVDLVFPHHENELAQARALDKPFAKYWVHNGLLTVNGEKMSKSLGNYISVEKALAACGGEPNALKMFFLNTHYRSPIDYSAKSLQAAVGRYRRMVNFFYRVMNTDLPTESSEQFTPHDILDLQDRFLTAMDDDLNTPRALAALDGMVAAGYAASEPMHRYIASKYMRTLGSIFGLFIGLKGHRLSKEQQQALNKREEARKRRDFTAADEIRTRFSSQGLVVEDTPDGPVVVPKA